jgi:hypothetical protein
MDKTTRDTLLHQASLLDQAATELEKASAGRMSDQAISQVIRQVSNTVQNIEAFLSC